MKDNIHQYLFFALFLFLLSSPLHSQGWERIYYTATGEGQDYLYSSANKVFLQADGGFLFPSNIENGTQLLSTDENGLITNLVNIPTSGGNLMRTFDLNFVYAGRTDASAPPLEDVFVRKFDEAGTILWTHFPEGYATGNEAVSDIIQSTDGSYVYVGARANLSPQQAFPYIAKINEAGDLLWKIVGSQLPENNIFDYKVIETSDGGLFMVASSNWFTVNNPIITDARKFDQNGNLVWSSNLDTDIQVRQLAIANDGNILLLGQKTTYATTVLKIDNSGTTISENILPFSAGQFLLTADGGFAFLGGVFGEGEDTDITLTKTDAAFNVEWIQTYGGPFRDIGNDFVQTPDSGFVIAGGANGMGENQSLYIIKTDEAGVSTANLIQGDVRYDINEDCITASQEQGLEDWIVSAAGSTGLFYSTVNENGYYQMELGPDTYTVSLILPNDYWNSCTNDVSTIVTDSSTVDFAVQSVEQCPLMVVAVQNYGMRLCEAATLHVLCQNQGTELAEDVRVEIVFDDSLQVLSASVPGVLLSDNTYSFDVGDIDFLEESSFTVQVQVGCDISLLGQSLCVEATIFPDTTCLPIDEMWSGASIELSATCEGEEVQLKIQNVGESPMPEALSYLVIEDHVIMLEGQSFGPLNVGESIVIPKTADGTFYRIESEQVANHPGMSMPSAFIEGCGTGTNGEVSLGFVNQYGFNDADYAIDINCTEVLAAYDPNAKSAFPEGYEQAHFIEANTRIDYLLHFQNTGTAVANKVVLVDRLPAELNPATIRQGASSHPYDFELMGDGIAQFTFYNIQLPDSTTNEAESHGFVQFSIAQKPDLALGTVINNTAAIYFDFNPAIFTNETYHTIGRNFITVDVGEIFIPDVSVKVFPNPFATSAIIELKSTATAVSPTLLLTDANGRIVRRGQFVDNVYHLTKGELAPGMYFYQISHQREIWNTGKIIIQ